MDAIDAGLSAQGGLLDLPPIAREQHRSETSTPRLGSLLRAASRDRVLILLAFSFIALAQVWNLITPVFEAPDEPAHLQHILFVAEYGRRPDLWTEVSQAGTAAYESPLYYLITGTLLRLSHVAHPFTYPVRNPDYSYGDPRGPLNYFLPVSSDYDYVHILRALSAVFGVVVVICGYLAAGLLGGSQTLQRTTAALIAFLPQFTFISGVLNNDALAAAFASMTIVLMLDLVRREQSSWLEALALGALIALAILSKPHTIFLLPFAGILMAVAWRGDYGRILRVVAWIVFGVVIVGGYYFAYNTVHYGDPLAMKITERVVPDQVMRKDLFDTYLDFHFTWLVYHSFLGVFGWMSVFLPEYFYFALAALGAAALGGLIVSIWRQRWDPIRLAQLAAPLLLFVMLIYANLTFNATQGRYFFPVLVPVMLLMSFGLNELPRRWRCLMLAAAPLFLLVANIYALALVANTFKLI